MKNPLPEKFYETTFGVMEQSVLAHLHHSLSCDKVRFGKGSEVTAEEIVAALGEAWESGLPLQFLRASEPPPPAASVIEISKVFLTASPELAAAHAAARSSNG